MIEGVLKWLHGKLNAPKIWSICLGCGRKYTYRNRRGELPGYCSATCVEHKRWSGQ